MFEQTVSGFWLKGILASAQAKGIDQQQVLTQAGVAILPDAINERVPLDATVNIWNAAIELTQDPLFGFHMGRQFRPNWFHLIHHLWANSPDVLSAINIALEYQALISDGGSLALTQHDGQAIITYQPRAAKLAFSYHQIDAVLTILVSLVRWSIDDQFTPTKISLPHAKPKNDQAFQAFFNCPIEYEASAAQLIFDERWLSHTMIGADPSLFEMHKQLADKKLAELGRGNIRSQIISKLNVLGQFQNISKEEVAQDLNISSRTLQRKLQQEDTSFTELSDQLRKSLAENYIAQGCSTSDLVSLLDFKEISSLHKACKRWFGCSLQEKRSQD
ncbi:AraC family transcriptional regulator ligand-binding domain-containing protein [Litoribrevibacter albus]|uniref:Transcriptional regulator n=1 Tax=Litoribrevibacter albus TaxID=1473156 RepID=A0AA37W5K4_9GAMM|nr:AraC family transcriptional regulator ligand-binding domain-containing protein [Litoribrevibacter albus]GLQ31272.1 transcriptional regulator [Litoribrevibacter albus]